MIRKNLFRIFYFPNLCNKINTLKYPWGWKSQSEIEVIKNYKLKDDVNVKDYDLKYIHEYQIKEYCEEMYMKTYYSYINNYDFLNTNLIPNLSNGLNYLRSNSNTNELNKNIKINNVKIILKLKIKYGRINNTSKYFVITILMK